jgi:hypothetical protein
MAPPLGIFCATTMMGRQKAKDSTAKSGKTVFLILMVSSVQNWILLDDLDTKVHRPGRSGNLHGFL